MDQFKKFLIRYKPAVPIQWLLALAGVMWTGVGILLCSYAHTWLKVLPWRRLLLPYVLGSIFAGIVYRFGFSKIALKNIRRILEYKEKACFFSFQEWKGYLIIAVMMTMGILLRKSPLPKSYLAVLYLTIGGGLFLSSFHYFGNLSSVDFSRKPPK